MSFNGATLHYHYEFPDITSLPTWGQSDISVSGPVTVAGLSVPGKYDASGLPIAPEVEIYRLVVDADSITFDFETTALFMYSYYGAPASFNGAVFEDRNDEIAAISNVRMQTNIPGLTQKNLAFTADSISIKFSGMATTKDSFIKLYTSFEKSEDDPLKSPANALGPSAGQSPDTDGVVHGTGGNDVLYEKDLPTTYMGGGGVDTIVYSGARASYKITGAQGAITLEKPNHVSDSLTDIQRLQFSDGTLAFDKGGSPGQAYRIYQAAFARTPDAAGLSYWVKIMDAGTTLESVAQGFVRSSEFAYLYGQDVSDRSFVEKVYHNVLGREGEAAGTHYWVEQLGSGMSKEHALAAFSESGENQAHVASAISDGIWYL